MKTESGINRNNVDQYLSGAEEELGNLRRDVSTGRYDKAGIMELRIPFQIMLWNLCLAWHSRNMTDSEYDALTDDEVRRLRFSIPNWSLSFQLVDIRDDVSGACNRAVGAAESQINRNSVDQYLSGAEEELGNLRRDVSTGRCDKAGIMELRIPFQIMLWNLCLAWHSRNMTDSEYDALTDDEVRRLRFSIPNWSLSFQLVDIRDNPLEIGKR